MKILRGLVPALTVALLLAACTPDPGASPTPSPPASASPTPVETPSPSPSPSPEPVFDPHPPLADLVVSTAGLLPLTMGEPPATNLGAAMISFDDLYCYDAEHNFSEPPYGRWAAEYSDRPFSVGATDEAVWRLDIWSPALATAEGIRRGSTLGELQAAYPALEGGIFGATSYVWWIGDSHGYVVFETQNEADWDAPAAATDEVILMRVLTAADDPAWHTANSGDVADACF